MSYYTALYRGIKCCGPSVCPSRASDCLEAEKQYKLIISRKQRWTMVTRGANLKVEVKVTGNENVKIVLLFCSSLLKVDRFSSN